VPARAHATRAGDDPGVRDDEQRAQTPIPILLLRQELDDRPGAAAHRKSEPMTLKGRDMTRGNDVRVAESLATHHDPGPSLDMMRSTLNRAHRKISRPRC